MELGSRCELRNEIIDEVSEGSVGGWLLFEKGANLGVDDLHYNALWLPSQFLYERYLLYA